MAWFTPFIIPAIMNAPQLLRNGNVGQYALNTGVGGGINTAVGNIAPNFNMNPAPSYAPGFNPPLASNIPGNLIGPQSVQQGLLSNAGSAASIGPNFSTANPLNTTSRSMMETLAQTSPQNAMTYNPQSVVDQNLFGTERIGPNLSGDIARQNEMTYGPLTQSQNVVPDMGKVVPPEARDLAQAGGYEEEGMFNKAFKNIKQYVEDKPLEAGMLGLTAGGAIYEGLKEPERPPTQPTLGPKLGGGQVNVGTPLQVARSTPRRRRA